MTESDLEWKSYGAKVAEAPPRRRVEKLAYRAPGTTSVPAQGESLEPWASEENGDADDRSADPGARAALHRLEERLREVEASAAAEAERLRREGRQAAEEARREAERRGREALDRAAAEIGAALASFRQEREEYFAQVEREVVKLALGIAARILHREALFDPLLLAGAVRVALGQLGETTGVRLRCPAGQVERWRELLAGLPKLAQAPEVVGDPALTSGDCVLEARIGSVDLGVRAQLEEIERGFFDLLERRPGGAGQRPGGVTGQGVG